MIVFSFKHVTDMRLRMDPAWKHVRRPGAVALLLSAAGCATSPWGFPVPTMIGNEQGVAMTGVVKAHDEDDVRRKLAQRLGCPDSIHFASLTTERADSDIGTKMMLYKAVMKCGRTGQRATSASAQ